MQNSADIVPLDQERSKRAAAPRLDDAGSMLRAAREEADLTLARVAEAINVKEDRLAAIEAMDFERLPSAPYTMGFVRAYADHLGLPVEPLVARFREEAGYVRSVTAPQVAPPPKDLAEGREVRLLGVLAVIGFVLWCVWQIVQAFAPDEEAALPSGFPIADRTEAPSVEYEVATSLETPLEEDLRRTPPEAVEVAEAAEAAGAAGAPGPEADAASESVRAASTAPAPSGAEETGSVADAGDAPTASVRPGLLPSVLASPTRADEPGAAAPPEAETDAPARPAAPDLNERLLLETLAASAPGRAAPDDGPITARAAAAARDAVETVPLPTEPQAEAPPPPAREAGEARPAPRPAPRPAVVTETPAQLTVPVPPVYPTRCESRADDRETVTVRFNVSRFGKVTGPSVVDSSNGCFDRAALNAVARFAFEPATRDGRPVPESDRTTRVVFRKP